MKRLFPILLLLINGCTTPYPLPSVPGGQGALVVDGVIYAGSDTTSIRLTRSKDFSDSTVLPVETGAQVVLESASGGAYPFTEAGAGYYTAPGLNLDPGGTYRLAIALASGAQYQSDYVPVVPSPPIDSITWQQATSPANQVTIYANTHDPAGKTRYYMWRYFETYEYHAEYISKLMAVGGQIYPRDTPVQVCYRNVNSADILIANSSALSSDVISQAPLEVLFSNDVRLQWEYSTLVTQVALTKDAYDFWQNIKANSGNLGSIFGPQPFQAQGNIHSVTNAREMVVGYVSISTPSRQRIYIDNGQLTNWPDTWPGCVLETLDLGKYPLSTFFSPGQTFIPVDNYVPNGSIEATSGACGDCRYAGGTLTKPSFWP